MIGARIVQSVAGWVRRRLGIYSVLDFGAVPNDTSAAARAANASAFVAAIRATGQAYRGARVAAPDAFFYFPGPLVVDRMVILEGAGGANAWLEGFGSTRLYFPDGSDGLIITRGGDTAYGAGLGPGDSSVIRDLCVVAEGKTIAGAHGIRMEARARLDNVHVSGFSGDGVHIEASITDAPARNANQWRIDGGRVEFCGGHGIYTAGSDSNAGLAQHTDIVANAGWGVYENSFLGNTYVGIHTDSNGTGPYWSEGVVNRSVFIGCYSESNQSPSKIMAPSAILGGAHDAQVTVSNTTRWPPRPGYPVAATSTAAGESVTVRSELGDYSGFLSALGFQASESALKWVLQYDTGAKLWAFRAGQGLSERTFILWDSGNTAGRRVGEIEFPYGFRMGAAQDLYGEGSPEGSVSAAPGSTYRNTNGGAGTSFYVKESGVGATGWVAK